MTLIIPERLFPILRRGWEQSGVEEFTREHPHAAPFGVEAVRRVHCALAEAARSAAPGLPIVLPIEDEEALDCLRIGWSTGAEHDDAITDANWEAINNIIGA